MRPRQQNPMFAPLLVGSHRWALLPHELWKMASCMPPMPLLQEWLRPLREPLRSLRGLLLRHNLYFLPLRMDPWKLGGQFSLFLQRGSHKEQRPFKVRLPVRLVQRVVELLRSSRTFAIDLVLVLVCPTPNTTNLRQFLLQFLRQFLLLLQFQVWLRDTTTPL